MKKILVAVLAACAVAAWASDAPKLPTTISPQWTEVAPGVWKTTIGKADDLTLLSAAGAQPALDALKAMSAAPFPLNAKEIEARQWESKTALRFPLGLQEDIYGLGVDFKNIRRNGSVFLLHVDHWGGQNGVIGRTHAPVPLYVSSDGYAVLINSARYITMSIAHGVRLAAKDKPPVIDRTTGKGWMAQPRSDSVEALVPAQGVEVIVFAGPTPLAAMQRYNLYCGGGALPPKWGLGFMARTPTKYSAEQALNEIMEFRKNGIPLDMLGLEPGWHDQAYPCSFEWDGKRFPDPKTFLGEVEKQHVRVNLWFNPYVSPTAPLYKKLLPFAGTHLVWNGIVPDYTMPEARRIFADHLAKTVVAVNPKAVGGFKIDEVDGYDRYIWPDVAMFPSGHDGEQLRQTYGVLLQRLVFDLFHQDNRRMLGQVRGSNAGASSLPFVIYNDQYDFNEYITAVANSGFAGVLWSPEVRGEPRDAKWPKGEDMMRRTQAVCFSPLALFNGWASDDKLWTYSEFKDNVRDAIVLRLRLLPYWYTTFAEYHYRGTPVVRPMQMVPGFNAAAASGQEGGKLDATANPYAISRVIEIKDQYMIGDALLVAPIAAGVKTRKVILPSGKWYNFYTGEFAGENQTIEVTPSLSQMPVFVKDGSLIPMIGERQWEPASDEILPLEVRHYGEQPGALALYDDDGDTFDYEKGEFSWTQLSATKDASGAWHGAVVPDKNGRAWHYSGVTWTFMTQPKK